LIRANSSSSSSTSTSTSTSTPSTTSPALKKPSPYRLIPVSTFLADFAPLHVKGWRLDNLPHVRHATQPKEGGMVELQDRHLTRRYDFQIGPEGWRDTLRFIAIIGEAIEVEDVSSDYRVSTIVQSFWGSGWTKYGKNTDKVASPHDQRVPSGGCFNVPTFTKDCRLRDFYIDTYAYSASAAQI
jgi:hypothetical protein